MKPKDRLINYAILSSATTTTHRPLINPIASPFKEDIPIDLSIKKPIKSIENESSSNLYKEFERPEFLSPPPTKHPIQNWLPQHTTGFCFPNIISKHYGHHHPNHLFPYLFINPECLTQNNLIKKSETNILDPFVMPYRLNGPDGLLLPFKSLEHSHHRDQTHSLLNGKFNGLDSSFYRRQQQQQHHHHQHHSHHHLLNLNQDRTNFSVDNLPVSSIESSSSSTSSSPYEYHVTDYYESKTNVDCKTHPQRQQAQRSNSNESVHKDTGSKRIESKKFDRVKLKKSNSFSSLSVLIKEKFKPNICRDLFRSKSENSLHLIATTYRKQLSGPDKNVVVSNTKNNEIEPNKSPKSIVSSTEPIVSSSISNNNGKFNNRKNSEQNGERNGLTVNSTDRIVCDSQIDVLDERIRSKKTDFIDKEVADRNKSTFNGLNGSNHRNILDLRVSQSSDSIVDSLKNGGDRSTIENDSERISLKKSIDSIANSNDTNGTSSVSPTSPSSRRVSAFHKPLSNHNGHQRNDDIEQAMLSKQHPIDFYKQYYYYLMQEPAFASRAAVAVAESYAKFLSNSPPSPEEKTTNSLINSNHLDSYSHLNHHHHLKNRLKEQSDHHSIHFDDGVNKDEILSDQFYDDHGLFESKRTSPDCSQDQAELRSADTTNGNLLFDRKRISRPLTGKHVRHGTGASPATLLSLRNMIQQRQKLRELGRFDCNQRNGRGRSNKRIKRK
ncbi:hypothetical protein SSS_09177 [Sarcoptes scabiei]|uniref:Uncharacterized protein n=1 Tax=Sarcoptes scabiei TaxID=52283 RepID=A0A834VDX3_SARSC|nr:hypothetical protein SSS_09177 [Sarcoptes scabiei]